MTSVDSNSLCLECGLCCDGVLFADVRLQPGDDADRLRALGLPAAKDSKSGFQKFPQPCPAFQQGRCRIYADRPMYCRGFECLLLQKVNDGRVETGVALRVIGAARRKAEAVKRLLRELGDGDERVALSVRFRRVKKRLESNLRDDHAAEVFGRLTLAVHDLNVLLSGAFYPGP